MPLSGAVKKAIIQMVGSGKSVEEIAEALEKRGVKFTLDELVSAIAEASKAEDEGPNSVDDAVALLKWLIEVQLSRVKRRRAVEESSPAPLAETANDIRLLSELLWKYLELTSRVQVDVAKLKEKMLFG